MAHGILASLTSTTWLRTDSPVLIKIFEDKIIETVEKNPVVVVIGETGSGKSTQLSQMLHIRGFTKSGMLCVTQPRRVTAVSVARWVAQELDVHLGEEVGYAIRFEDRTSEKTRIKYLIDGVHLRESLSDPELSQYSVIILDEAHERSLNTLAHTMHHHYWWHPDLQPRAFLVKALVLKASVVS